MRHHTKNIDNNFETVISDTDISNIELRLELNVTDTGSFQVLGIIKNFNNISATKNEYFKIKVTELYNEKDYFWGLCANLIRAK